MAKLVTTESAHRKVIAAIHNHWYNGDPFALRDAARAAAVSGSSVVRTLKILRNLRLVHHSARAYAGRHYRVTMKWPASLPEAWREFEYAKILKL